MFLFQQPVMALRVYYNNFHHHYVEFCALN